MSLLWWCNNVNVLFLGTKPDCIYPVNYVSKSYVMRNWYLFVGVWCGWSEALRFMQFLFFSLSSYVFFNQIFLWINHQQMCSVCGAHMKYILLQDAYDIRWGLCMDAGTEREKNVNQSKWLDLHLEVCGCQVLSSMSIYVTLFRNCTFHGSSQILQLSHLQCQLLSRWFSCTRGCNSELSGRFSSNRLFYPFCQ